MDRRDIDDLATTLLHHLAGGDLADYESAIKIDGDHSVPFLISDFKERLLYFNPGIIDENIQTPELRYNLLHHALDIFALADIGSNGNRSRAKGGGFGHGGIYVVLPAGAIVDGNVCAFGGKPCGDGFTDAAAGSGHECDFVR